MQRRSWQNFRSLARETPSLVWEQNSRTRVLVRLDSSGSRAKESRKEARNRTCADLSLSHLLTTLQQERASGGGGSGGGSSSRCTSIQRQSASRHTSSCRTHSRPPDSSERLLLLSLTL